MKKLNIFRILNAILIVGFLISLFVQMYVPVIKIHFSGFWFPAFCSFVSVSLILKSIFFASESTIWFTCTFILFTAVMFSLVLTDVVISFIWPVFITIPGISCLIAGLLFKDVLELKISLFLISLNIGMYLFALKIVNISWFIAIMFASLMFVLLAFKVMPALKNLKKEENGKV